MSNLLRGNIECLSTHVYLLIDIDTGQYEEDAGAAGAASKEEAQPEDDRPFVLLHHLPKDTKVIIFLMMITMVMVMVMVQKNTLRQKQREKGRVTTMMMRERQVRAHLQQSSSSSSS